MTITQHYALITGATSGIGYELAKLVAADGYNLIIVARDQHELNKTANDLSNQYGVKIMPLAKDLFNVKAAHEVYDLVKAKGLEIEILINDAGQGLYGEFVETDLRRELDIIQLNVSSVVVLTKLFLQDMIKSGSGKILNVSSVASKLPGPLQAVYHGTKAFIQSFTEAIREEVKSKKIVVTTLLPGPTNTDFFNKAGMQHSKIVVNEDLADPATVAKDGYEALKSGDDMIISGMSNKLQVAMGTVIPDSMLARMMHKRQEPVEEEKK